MYERPPAPFVGRGSRRSDARLDAITETLAIGCPYRQCSGKRMPKAACAPARRWYTRSFTSHPYSVGQTLPRRRIPSLETCRGRMGAHWLYIGHASYGEPKGG